MVSSSRVEHKTKLRQGVPQGIRALPRSPRVQSAKTPVKTRKKVFSYNNLLQKVKSKVTDIFHCSRRVREKALLSLCRGSKPVYVLIPV